MDVLEENAASSAAQPRFSVDVTRTNNTAVIRCSGRLCFLGDAKLLADAAQKLLCDGADLVLDFDSLGIIDSAGIGELVLINMQARALQRDICIVAASEHVRHLLKLTNVASLFEFFDSIDAALKNASSTAA